MRGNRSRPVQGDSSKLIVGRDIRLKGEISACSRIVVEGYVEASLVDARTLEVTPTGHFKGNAEVEEADISGHFEGELIARDKLIVRNQGKISGSVRYGRIIVESGGVVAGDMQALPATDRPGQKREGGLSGSRIGTDKTS
ncbi:MAG: polymer-forming cytoskeletal protein [Rhodospirillales bacterium]|nr:polymer-forming cytoskeletal protein [Rhodospirillales bacterium]